MAELRNVPIASLRYPFETPCRESPAQKTEIQGSLAEVGQLFPIEVSQLEGAQHEVLDGGRLARGMERLGKDEVMAVVLPPLTEEEQLLRRLTRDVSQVQRNPMVVAGWIERLLAITGITADAMAKRLATSPAKLSRLLRVHNDPALRAAVAAEKLTMKRAYPISQVADAAKRSALLAQALTATGGVNADKVRQPLTVAHALRKRITLRMGGFGSVAVLAPEITLEGLADNLSRLADKARQAHAQGLGVPQFAAALREAKPARKAGVS